MLVYRKKLLGQIFFGKGKQEWEQACCDSGMRHLKLKTLVKTKLQGMS